MAAAIRPTGKRTLEIGLDVRYLEGAAIANGDLWLPRASVAVAVMAAPQFTTPASVHALPRRRRWFQLLPPAAVVAAPIRRT